jgi:predicted HicB family RNase H-like nuclease
MLPPDKQYSGKFMLRVDPELHKALAINSVKEGKSLNAYVTEKLRKS